MSIKYKIASAVATVLRFGLTKIMHRPAGFFPGKIALKIYPELLSELQSKFNGKIIMVTGTNGKTSVTALISKILKNERADVVTNSTGANMQSGIASACLAHKFNPRRKTYGVFEIDELWVEKTVPTLCPDYLMLLNLFPDQQDRYGSIENIQKSLFNALGDAKTTTFVYNADDPNCQILAEYIPNNKISFGCNEKISAGDIDGLPNQSCPRCETPLNYLTDQYAQLGNYQCSNCGFTRAKLNYSAAEISLNQNGLSWKVGSLKIQTYNQAEYFVYNFTAVVAMCDLLGAKSENIISVLKNHKNEKGRMQEFDIDNKHVTINLAKNPAGFNQNLKYIWSKNPSSPFTVAFFVNKKEGDGRSANWLNDVSFKSLSKFNPQVLIGGEAIKELSNALNHGNLIAHRVENADDILQESTCEEIYIIANYTAMFPLLDELTDIQAKSSKNN